MEQDTVEWRIRSLAGLVCNLDFGKGERPESKVEINKYR